jgi:DNA replication protein DnaC
MDELLALKPKLTRLKLSGISETLEARITQAMREKWSFSQFLEVLLSDEVERRDFKQLGRRITRSSLEPEKTLETFNFRFNPSIHEPTIRELATCQFIAKHENAFLVGPSGVGKSHLGQALGHEACRKGYEVLCRRTSQLLGWVEAGRGDNSHERRAKQLGSVDLLILDDFGLTPLSEEKQADLYEIICQRYERASMIITSNRDFAEWPMVFANPLMGSAALDRLVHRAVKIVIEGKSYRVDSFVRRSKRTSVTSGKDA